MPLGRGRFKNLFKKTKGDPVTPTITGGGNDQLGDMSHHPHGFEKNLFIGTVFFSRNTNISTTPQSSSLLSSQSSSNTIPLEAILMSTAESLEELGDNEASSQLARVIEREFGPEEERYPWEER